uniref:Vitelline membrane outer layer 1-like protein n=1 Tax=Neogobius melanostomus TaxID=47308 RepID=A0A8C6WF68_9GOBI
MWESGAFEGTMALTTLNVLTVLTALLLCAQGQEEVIFQRAGTAFNSRSYSSLLTVTNGERFGSWTWPETCPEDFLAVGFSVRVESYQYGRDDTALNGVRLICLRVEPYQGWFRDDTAVNNIRFRCSSHSTLEGAGMSWGEYGLWSQECEGGICGVETKMEENQGAWTTPHSTTCASAAAKRAHR